MPQEFLTTPERLRYQTVPASLLEVDIRQHFHLTEADRTFLTSFRGAANRLGLALQVGVLRLMGFLPEAWASQLPPEAVAFVATQLATEVTYLADYGARQQTRSDHFLAVLRHLAYRKWEPLDAAWLEPWLVERALEHDGDRVLLAMTCQKLHQARIARPAIGTLERLVGGISDLATQETYRRLAPLLTDEVRQQLDALLLPETGRQLTRHRWLVQPATVSNPAAIVTALDKLRYLDGLGVASWDVSSLHPNRQKRLALLARSRSNRNLERLPAAKRYSVLVAFVRESYLTLTDEVLSMVDAFWEQSLAKARRAHDQYQQQVVAAKDTALRTLAQAVEIVLDEDQTPAGQVRPRIYAQVLREDLVLAWEAVQTMLYPTRHSHLSFLAKRYPLFKQFTPRLLEQLGFQQGFAGDDFGAALQLVSELQAGRRRKLPEQAPTDFLKPTWRKFVLGDQLSAEQQRPAYELAVLATLRDRLRSGDVYVAPSHRYADLSSYLIPPAEWEQMRPELCAQLGLPLVTADRLTERVQELADLLGPMKTLLDAGGEVRLEAGELVVTRSAAQEVPTGAQALQAFL